MNYNFEPRRGGNLITGLALIAFAAAAGVMGYRAYEDRATADIGVAALLALVTVLIWAVRAGSTTARLSIVNGQLEVIRGAKRDVIDLGSHYTRIETRGKPGERGWRVLFERYGQDPLAIDASMVDPAEFTEALAAHRPTGDTGV